MDENNHDKRCGKIGVLLIIIKEIILLTADRNVVYVSANLTGRVSHIAEPHHHETGT